jgi:hypothetical protein
MTEEALMHATWQILIAGLALAAGLPATSPPSVLQPVDISDPISYFIADGRGKTGFPATDAELARWALGVGESLRQGDSVRGGA